MLWRSLFLVCLASGILADNVIDQQREAMLANVFGTQCKKNGAENKTEEVKNAGKNIVKCVTDIINIETIKQEIEEAKPKGALDEVFGKYCAKSPQLKECFHTAIQSVTPCLDPKIREHTSSISNSIDQLIDFACYKDGDRIALFIAEGGTTCFMEKNEEIRQCGEKLRETIPSLDAAKDLSQKEQCGKFDELTSCIVKVLEGCSTPTPANMAESLVRFVRKGSPCKDIK